MLSKLGPADFLRMPWKNGGGETCQIAVWPPGANLDNFDWRITSATVSCSGPFSPFPGIDRSLAVLTGGELRLQVEGEPIVMTAASPPLVFGGDASVMSDMDAGCGIIDFNVMTRRTRYTHRLTRHRLSQPLALEASTVLVYCLEGAVMLTADGTHQLAQAGEALLWQSESLQSALSRPVHLAPHGESGLASAEMMLVEIFQRWLG